MVWQDAYAAPGNPFGVKDPRFYGPQGHRGKDFYRKRGQFIPAYEHGRVVSRSYSRYIGYCIVVRYDSGAYAGWAHTIDGSRIPVGTEVFPGTTVAAVAGAGDDPGSTWAGEHIHTTLGPSIESIFSGEVWDPGPSIQGAIDRANAAGGNITPIIKEWDEMATREEIAQVVGNRPGFAVISYSGAGRNGIVLAGPGYWHMFTGEEFREVYQGVPGLFAGIPVITPINDRHYDIIKDIFIRNEAELGGTSAAPAVSAKEIATELARQPEVIAAVKEAFALDYAQLVKMINDDAAARMRE